jgi:hypothetical protein
MFNIGISLMYKLNNNGLKTAPCGTPTLIGSKFVLNELICTQKSRFFRNSINHLMLIIGIL